VLLFASCLSCLNEFVKITNGVHGPCPKVALKHGAEPGWGKPNLSLHVSKHQQLDVPKRPMPAQASTGEQGSYKRSDVVEVETG